jgi:hypothetical protein
VWGQDLRAPFLSHLRLFLGVFFDLCCFVSLVWGQDLRPLSFSSLARRVPLGFY